MHEIKKKYLLLAWQGDFWCKLAENEFLLMLNCGHRKED